MKLRWICALASAGSLLWGQAGNVVGPSAGYVFDPSARVLRPVRGIPGAALLGDALDLGMNLTAAEVAPRGDSALAVAADGSAHLFRLNNGLAVERPVSGLIGPAGIVFSPSGTAAALYRPGNVQVLKGLPDAPEVGTTLALPSIGSLAAEAAAAGRRQRPAQETIAISDDAAYLLFARAGEVDLVPVAGGTRKLMDSQAGALVAFAAGHDAAVATGGVITLYQDVTGASTRRDFPGVGVGAGLAFSADGGRILAAGLRSVVVLDRVSGDRQTVALDFQPSGIAAMGALFRLNQPGSGPLWLLDGVAAEPKLWFVPARAGL